MHYIIIKLKLYFYALNFAVLAWQHAWEMLFVYVVAHVKHSKSITSDIPFKQLEVICICRRNIRFWN